MGSWGAVFDAGSLRGEGDGLDAEPPDAFPQFVGEGSGVGGGDHVDLFSGVDEGDLGLVVGVVDEFESGFPEIVDVVPRVLEGFPRLSSLM